MMHARTYTHIHLHIRKHTHTHAHKTHLTSFRRAPLCESCLRRASVLGVSLATVKQTPPYPLSTAPHSPSFLLPCRFASRFCSTPTSTLFSQSPASFLRPLSPPLLTSPLSFSPPVFPFSALLFSLPIFHSTSFSALRAYRFFSPRPALRAHQLNH